MKVAILAGGLGSRLAEETELKPKPMVEIGGKPILVPEKPAKRQGYLSMLVPFVARREGPGIVQNLAPEFDKVIYRVKRMFLYRLTINRRHIGPLSCSQSPRDR